MEERVEKSSQENGKSFRQSPQKVAFAGACVLVFIGIFVYGNNLSGPFIWDDIAAVVENRQISRIWPPKEAFLASLSSPTQVGRPVVNFSLAVNYALCGLDVRGYHVFNISVHILCALVLFGVIRRTLVCESLGDRFGRASGGIALACALIWMVHPLQTECVNYITQRSESMMGLFFLLTLYCAILAINSRRRYWWYAASVFSCVVGMATKEVMVSAPVLVFLYDIIFVRGSLRELLRKRWILYAGLASTWIVLGTLTYLYSLKWMAGAIDKASLVLEVGALDYAMNQCIVILHYLRLVFWPYPLVLDYGFPQRVPVGEVLPYAVLLMVLLIATITALFVRPKIGFLGAWLFVILSPTSSFVLLVTEVGAERRMYLPLAGIVILLVITGYILSEKLSVRLRPTKESVIPPTRFGFGCCLCSILLIAVAGLLIWRTVLRNQDYKSDVTIWRTSVAAMPENFRAQSYLGTALTNAGKPEEALTHYYKAKETNPGDSGVYSNIGAALNAQGKFDEAVSYLQKSIELDPNNPQAYNNLGMSFQLQGKLDKAIEQYRHAIRIAPHSAMVHNSLGSALTAKGQLNDALGHLREALRLRPDLPQPMIVTAMILTVHPDPNVRNVSEAVTLARRACELTKYQNPVMLKTLASAYAAAGHYDPAIITMQKALAIAKRTNDKSLILGIQKQIELLKQKKTRVKP